MSSPAPHLRTIPTVFTDLTVLDDRVDFQAWSAPPSSHLDARIGMMAGEYAAVGAGTQDRSGRRLLCWVRKRDGLGIRLIDSTDARVRGVRDVALIE